MTWKVRSDINRHSGAVSANVIQPACCPTAKQMMNRIPNKTRIETRRIRSRKCWLRDVHGVVDNYKDEVYSSRKICRN